MNSSKVGPILLFSIVVGCTAAERDEINLPDVPCYETYVVSHTQSEYLIHNNGEIVFRGEYCPKCFDSSLYNIANSNKLMVHGDNVILIDCKRDSLFTFKIESRPYFSMKRNCVIDLVENYYLYSDDCTFYLFDDQLTPIYDSWSFLENMADTNRLGLSSAKIGFEFEREKEIIVQYDLYTDIFPFHFATLFDTILLQQ